MSPKIVVLDYGVGNVRSIVNAFQKVEASILLTRDEDTILNADGVVLPGVGAFAHGMRNLKKFSLIEIIKKYVQSNKPLLGICLGMQLLLDESEEFGTTKGLGIVEGKVIKLPVGNLNYEKLPHVSWNEIERKNNSWDQTVFENIENQSDMYFSHSYVAVPDDEKHVLSVTNYSDYEFCSALKKGQVFGCQFHPEKSGERGLRVVENFINLCRKSSYG